MKWRYLRNFIRVLAWSACSVLAACSSPEAPVKQQFYSFGTIVEVSLWNVQPAHAEEVLKQLQEDMDYMHETWHAWHNGPVSRLNSLLPHGKPFSVAPSVLPLIEQSKVLYQKSNGLFNPAIGGLITLWGFAQDEPPLGPPPTENEIKAFVDNLPTMDDLEIDGISIHSKNPRLQLNFGAYAKGYAVDMLMQRMREMGVTNGIINAGGDLRAIGSKGGKPWRIAIRHPQGQGVLAFVEIQGDESVFTSGNYERFFTYEDRRYHHILDPRTGYPAKGSTSVTVIHTNAAEADAAATAIFVAGPGHWQATAAAMGMTQVMVVDEALAIEMTPAMARRVQFPADPPPQVQIREPS